jgi:hypothetical protein
MTYLIDTDWVASWLTGNSTMALAAAPAPLRVPSVGRARAGPGGRACLRRSARRPLAVMTHRVTPCANSGPVLPLVGHGLCSACYHYRRRPGADRPREGLGPRIVPGIPCRTCGALKSLPGRGWCGQRAPGAARAAGRGSGPVAGAGQWQSRGRRARVRVPSRRTPRASRSPWPAGSQRADVSCSAVGARRRRVAGRHWCAIPHRD